MSIFCEMAGMAFSSSEKRSTLPPNSRNRITSFQRPSRNLSACSTRSAAELGVSASSLLIGEYLTFSCVLVFRSAYLQVRSAATEPDKLQALGTTWRTCMSNQLPPPLAAYYEAKNQHDIDGMLVPFAEDAVV